MPASYTLETRDMFKTPQRNFGARLADEVGLNPAQIKLTIDILLDYQQAYFSSSRAPGVIVYTAVAASQPAGRPIRSCKTLPVQLTAFHENDLDVMRESGTVELRAVRLLRFCLEAKKQGALLSYEDLSILLGVNDTTIRDLVARLRKQGLEPPTRGAIKDMGREPSHKSEIVYRLGKGDSTRRVAAATGHSEHAIGRYQLQFGRLLAMLERYPQASEDQLRQLSALTESAFLIYFMIAKELLQRKDCQPHLERIRNRYLLENPEPPVPPASTKVPPGKRPENLAEIRLEQRTLDTVLRQTLQEDFDATRRVAEAVTVDLRKAIDQAFVVSDRLRPGEASIFVDALQKPYFNGTPSPDRKVIAVTVPLATEEILKLWRADEPTTQRRARVAIRIASAALEQGGVMAINQLSELLHVTSSTLAKDIRTLVIESELEPEPATKGYVEDAGPTLTHKNWIIGLDQHGFTGEEISWLTRHAPHSRDRYIETYRRAEIVMNLDGVIPDVHHLSRLFQLRVGVAQQYVDLLERYHPDKVARSKATAPAEPQGSPAAAQV